MNKEIRFQMYITAQFENPNTGKSGLLPLPAKTWEFQRLVSALGGFPNELCLTGYQSCVPCLNKDILLESPFSEINHLALKLSMLKQDEIEKLCAIAESHHAFKNIESFIDFTYRTYIFDLTPGIRNEEDLGIYYIGNASDTFPCHNKITLIDREEYGRRLAVYEDGSFTNYGYLAPKFDLDYDNLREWSIPEIFDITDSLGEDYFLESEDCCAFTAAFDEVSGDILAESDILMALTTDSDEQELEIILLIL